MSIITAYCLILALSINLVVLAISFPWWIDYGSHTKWVGFANWKKLFQGRRT